MADSWHTVTEQLPEAATPMMKAEAQWWANNRFSNLKEPYPIERKPFKAMTPEGFKNLQRSMMTTEEDIDLEIKRVTEPFKEFSEESLKELKKSMMSRIDTIDKEIELDRQKAIKLHAETRFNTFEMELSMHVPEMLNTLKWLAYLHYSKEQHDIRASQGVSDTLKDHIAKHGQLVKMDK